ncbi:pilus assembly protein [Streptomyces sp. LHD-70]|uniref:TadE family protein n=1 Tax=Streptomyces sp. LHD-70 TaxID=3072140 RepID=UPI00280D69FE|nr:pilus assembly protein [Streptomyces sp. LHD-70]MDQ8707520.1 pilus assembly protein [Streptomyces sp. LHD-70]
MSIAVPLAFLMVFGLIQFGLWFHGRSVAHHAAQQAVDAQRVHDAAPGAGAEAAQGFLGRMGGSLNGAQVEVDMEGDEVRAVVEGTVINLVPGWDGRVSQQVQAPVEKFRP